MDTVYIETAIVSHTTAWPSNDPATAVLQDQAKRWMVEQRPKFSVVTSRLVLDEAARGDADAARRRLALLVDIPILDPNPDVETVADEIVARSLIPESAKLDAFHVAAAVWAGVQFFLTQNCRHIANAAVLPRFYRLLEDLGLSGPLIYTPAEFFGGSNDAN